jgi:hypothetical protein
LIEVRETNEQLRTQLRLAHCPQLLLRMGRAPAATATPRRPITDMLIER